MAHINTLVRDTEFTHDATILNPFDEFMRIVARSTDLRHMHTRKCHDIIYSYAGKELAHKSIVYKRGKPISIRVTIF